MLVKNLIQCAYKFSSNVHTNFHPMCIQNLIQCVYKISSNAHTNFHPMWYTFLSNVHTKFHAMYMHIFLQCLYKISSNEHSDFHLMCIQKFDPMNIQIFIQCDTNFYPMCIQNFIQCACIFSNIKKKISQIQYPKKQVLCKCLCGEVIYFIIKITCYHIFKHFSFFSWFPSISDYF